MTRINQLSRIDTLADGDLLPVWATSKGDDRATAMSVMLEYIQDNLIFPAVKSTQREQPDQEGFTVRVQSNTGWLLLRPQATYATGNVILPPEPEDNDQIIISTTRTISILSITSDIVTVPRLNGVLESHHGTTMRYDATLNNWYVTSAP